MRGKGPSWSAWTTAAPVAASCVEVESHRLERPARRAVAAREAAPHVLVRIDEEVEAVAAGALDDGADVVEIRLVVAAGPGVLDRLPGDHAAAGRSGPRRAGGRSARRPPPAGTGARRRRRRGGRRSPRAVGRAVRPGRHLAAAAQIDPAQDQRSAPLVHEPGPGDSDRHRRGQSSRRPRIRDPVPFNRRRDRPRKQADPPGGRGHDLAGCDRRRILRPREPRARAAAAGPGAQPAAAPGIHDGPVPAR